MLQTEAGRGVLCPPSFGPGDVASFQKLYEEKRDYTQIRTGPSLYLVESGWKSTLWIW